MPRRKNSTWGQMCPPEALLAKPTQFELMLARLNIPATLLAIRENPAATKWIKNHYGSRYVPESILEGLGLSLPWGSLEP